MSVEEMCRPETKALVLPRWEEALLSWPLEPSCDQRFVSRVAALYSVAFIVSLMVRDMGLSLYIEGDPMYPRIQYHVLHAAPKGPRRTLSIIMIPSWRSIYKQKK
jgi:hypothetical protein